MVEENKVMDRRKFLHRFITLFSGSLLGLNSLSKAFANEYSSDQPKVAIIIDDIGFSRPRLTKFLEIGIPMTFAVLPRLSKTHILAEEIHALGHEIMLHQPMEPFDPQIDPGPGALYVGDKSNKIDRIIEENIAEVPYATGINNHMGSRFTACQKEIKEALKVVKARGLFFIDSLTTRRSMGYKTAIRLNMATACRNVFLDNSPEEPAILLQLYKLQQHAEKYGHAIGIGHPYVETAKAIASFKGIIRKSGISMVQVSQLVSLNH
jgi:polysaccharide deacetylase 2 family uncharacterized protein YibQ